MTIVRASQTGMLDKMIAIILGMRDVEKLALLLGFTARRLGELTHNKASEVLRATASIMEEMGK